MYSLTIHIAYPIWCCHVAKEPFSTQSLHCRCTS